MYKRLMKGFTLVELMIVVAIIGILAAVAIPAFIKYIRRSKTTEATMNIRKMYDSLVAYYEAEHADKGGNILARQFPTAIAWSPVQTVCCASVGQKCAPVANSGLWTNATWQALNFSIDDPFYYSYQTVGTGGATAGDFYNLQASGDLNCNTVYSLYQRTATVDGAFNLNGGSGLYVVNDIE